VALRSNRAFSLIEVLVTVGIISSTIIFLFRSFATALAGAKFGQEIQLGCYLAEEKAWEVQKAYSLGLKTPEASAEKRQNKEFNWSYDLQDASIPGLKELKIKVSWQQNQRKNAYSLDFQTYLPAKK
jgi:prepilin-type N-terminal cleavage/methylation domain-containing protein